jgi:hypothetical protein
MFVDYKKEHNLITAFDIQELNQKSYYITKY